MCPSVPATGNARHRVVTLGVGGNAPHRPIGPLRVGANIAQPGHGVIGNRVVVGLGNVDRHFVTVNALDGDINNGWNLEVDRKVLKGDVRGVNRREGRHLSVEHEGRTTTVNGDVLGALNEQANLHVLVVLVGAHSVRHIQGALLRHLGEDVVAALRETHNSAAAICRVGFRFGDCCANSGSCVLTRIRMNSVSANVNNQGIALGSKSSLRAHYTGKNQSSGHGQRQSATTSLARVGHQTGLCGHRLTRMASAVLLSTWDVANKDARSHHRGPPCRGIIATFHPRGK